MANNILDRIVSVLDSEYWTDEEETINYGITNDELNELVEELNLLDEEGYNPFWGPYDEDVVNSPTKLFGRQTEGKLIRLVIE